MLRECLIRSVVSHCPLTEREILQFEAHWALLKRWNARLNLTRIVNEEEAAVRHYGESVFLARELPDGGLRVADVGSGPGFPGIPLAILRPECVVTLIESHRRKAVFLQEASRALTNVRVLSARAENVKEDFDWVVARAVSWNDLKPSVFRLAPQVCLLAGADPIPGEVSRIPLPWGKSRYVVRVSRETSV